MFNVHRSANAILSGLLCVAALTASGIAAAVSWTYLGGPFGGQPLALFADKAGNTWAGLNGSGVFQRAAGTATWVARPGLPTQSNNAFAAGPAGTTYVTGSGGVYALAAGAAAWQAVDGAHGLPSGAGSGIATDAQGAVHVAMDTNPAGVFKLAPGATEWVAVGTGLPVTNAANELAFDGAGNLWATVYGSGVFKLPAGGSTWSAVNGGLANTNVQGLAVVGSDLFAGAQFGGAYKLANAAGGGTTWAPWVGGSLGEGDAIYALTVGAGNTLYAAGYGVVHALASGAANWTQVGAGLTAFGPTYSIAYSSADGVLTVGNQGGILNLPAGNTLWQPGNDGMAASTIYGMAVAANGDLYAATFGQGVQKLASGASAWTAVDPTHASGPVQSIVQDGLGNLFIAATGRVLKLTGSAWAAPATQGNTFAYSLAVDASNALWAGQYGSVSRLVPGAADWSDVGTGLPEDESVVALAFDGAGTAYAGFADSGVYALSAGGGAWTETNTGLEDTYVRTLARDAGGTMHAGTNGGVFKFVAGAWQPVGIGLTDPVHALAFDAAGDLYAGVENGYVWRLRAGRAKWAQIGLGMQSRTATAFAVGGGKLYAGTDAGGGAPSGAYVFVPLDSVVEFYNDILDNFFITANPDEQAAVLDGGAGPGWAATGNYFNAGGPLQVCRFYGSIAPGPNSHFYTIDPAECQLLKDIAASTPATQQRWNFESNDFSSASPAGGGCAAGLVPVYRAYNNGFVRHVDSNHRITSSRDDYLAQVAKGWVGEGVVMCAPAQ